MSDPLISVVTRTRDRPVLLARAARGLLAQTAPPERLEWVLVNDGGAREAPETQASKLEAAGWRVKRLHHDTPVGRAAAANVGVRACRGEYVLLHDDDDWMEPSGLADLAAGLDAAPEAAAAIGNYILVTEGMRRGRMRTIREQGVYPPYPLTILQLAGRNRFPPIAAMYRRDAFEAVGGYPEDHDVLEDWVFHLRLAMSRDLTRVRSTVGRYSIRPDATGVLANSVVAEARRHEFADAKLRDEALRASIARGLVDEGMIFAAGTLYLNQERNESRFNVLRRAVDAVPGGRWLRARLAGR